MNGRFPIIGHQHLKTGLLQVGSHQTDYFFVVVNDQNSLFYHFSIQVPGTEESA